MRLVPVNSVKEGYFLGKTIYDENGRILLKQGAALNKALIESIKKVGLQTIYINDEFSTNEIEEIIKPEIKLKAVKSIKQTFEQLQKFSKTSKNHSGDYKQRLIQKRRDEQIEELRQVSSAIVDEIISSKNTMINLVDIKSADSYTYEHSVNVAVLSLILGVELGLSQKQLNELCVGALLHDIGKAFIPKEILDKPDNLTPEEFEIIKQHPSRGYEYIKEDRHLASAIKVIVLQHHERVDGTGYPRNINGDQIHTLAKIVAVADVYDAIISDRPYKKAISPNEAIELIMGSAGRHFDFEIAQTFVRKIIPYPVGTLVKLSNGEVGVVDDVRPNFPLRPVVKIIRQNAVNVEIKTVDLIEDNSLVIEGIQHEYPNLSIPNYLKRT